MSIFGQGRIFSMLSDRACDAILDKGVNQELWGSVIQFLKHHCAIVDCRYSLPKQTPTTLKALALS
jgi:hypothetical protein